MFNTFHGINENCKVANSIVHIASYINAIGRNRVLWRQ